MQPKPDRVISSILRHDRKQNGYKIALLRALNDTVPSFPDMLAHDRNIAVPLRVLARYWVAYFWPFVDPAAPIYQGQRRSLASGGLAQDREFRAALEALRKEWEIVIGQQANASDGFVLIADMMVDRKRAGHPPSFVAAYLRLLAGIEKAVRQPIQFAGEGHWGTFDQPTLFQLLGPDVVGVPGTQPSDTCVVVRAELWRTFADLSLWIEALSIHEWCLYTETVVQPPGSTVDRGKVYLLLTDRPDNRLPSPSALVAAIPRLELAYAHYGGKPYLAEALARDVRCRFSALVGNDAENAPAIARAVSGYLAQLAEARNIARFEVA